MQAILRKDNAVGCTTPGATTPLSFASVSCILFVISQPSIPDLHYWKINESPKHVTGLTRLGNTTFLVSQKQLSPILRKDTDQNQHLLDVTGNVRRMCSLLLILLSSFTWPHNYTRNEAHLLPATLPHRHAVFRVIQPIRRTAQEPAPGRGFPKRPLHPLYHQSPRSMPQIFTFSNRINPTKCQLWSCTPFLLGTSRESISHRCLCFLPTQDTCAQPDFKTL